MKKFLLIVIILMVLILGVSLNGSALDIIPIVLTPAAPDGLSQPSIFSHAGPNYVNLVWNDNSSNETGFRIESKNFNNYTWYTLANIGANIEEYKVSGLTPSTDYTIRIVAYNSYGDSDTSNEYSFTTSPKITLITPNGGSLSGGTTVNIQWEIDGDHTGITGGDVGVSMYYNTDGSNYYPYIINRTTVMAGDGSYSWVVPNVNTDYMHIMILFTKTGIGYSYTVSDTNDNNIKVSYPILTFNPIKPSHVTAKAISSSEIELSWDQSGNDKDGFKIYRKSGLGPYSLIATVDSKTYKLVDSNLSAGTTYSYQVYAYNALGTSPVSNTASATTEFLPIVIIPLNLTPGEPENLSAEMIGITQVDLSWEKGDNYATGFSLERKKGTGIGVFTEIADLGSSIASYTDTGVASGNTYQYRIRAYNNFGYSSYSDTVTVEMPYFEIMPLLPDIIIPVFPIVTNEEDTEETEETEPVDAYPSASEWAKPEISEAVSYGLTTEDILNNFQKAITREEFCEIVVKLYEASSGKIALPIEPNPFTDTNNPEILKAYRLGIVNGISTDMFAPDKNITRQEICVMLLRELKAVNPGQDYTASGIEPFADQNQIATWAIDAVKYMNQENIMKGVGANNINPLGNTTREQAIALILRTYLQFGS